MISINITVPVLFFTKAISTVELPAAGSEAYLAEAMKREIYCSIYFDTWVYSNAYV
jgi:hypothetical protein